MTSEEIYEDARREILSSPGLRILLKIDPRALDSDTILAALVNMYALGVKAGMLKALNGDESKRSAPH